MDFATVTININETENPVVIQENDELYLKLQLQTEKELRRNLINDRITYLYNSNIENFRKGDKLSFNPNIFSKLTREKFVGWILCNNPEIAEIFS